MFYDEEQDAEKFMFLEELLENDPDLPKRIEERLAKER